MDRITSIIPTPKPLRVTAAGVTVQVSEFTLRDLADLQAILDARQVDPLLEIGPALEGADGDERRRLLVSAWEKANVGPGIYGEPSGRVYFGTAEGAAALVWVALRRHQPALTPEAAARLLMEMTAAEFDCLFRLAHGHSTRRSLAMMLSPFPWTAPTGNAPTTWGKAIEEVIEAHPGWTYRDVYDLTLSEWVNARNAGHAPSDDVPAPAGMDPVLALAELRRAFYGDSGPVAQDGEGVIR